MCQGRIEGVSKAKTQEGCEAAAPVEDMKGSGRKYIYSWEWDKMRPQFPITVHCTTKGLFAKERREAFVAR